MAVTVRSFNGDCGRLASEPSGIQHDSFRALSPDYSAASGLPSEEITLASARIIGSYDNLCSSKSALGTLKINVREMLREYLHKLLGFAVETRTDLSLTLGGNVVDLKDLTLE